MIKRERALALLAAADALSVVCDQLDELALLECSLLVALCAARAYRYAGNRFAAAGADTEATFAFAHASEHYARAGHKRNAATLRDRALGGMPRTMSISLNGRRMDVELPAERKKTMTVMPRFQMFAAWREAKDARDAADIEKQLFARLSPDEVRRCSAAVERWRWRPRYRYGCSSQSNRKHHPTRGRTVTEDRKSCLADEGQDLRNTHGCRAVGEGQRLQRHRASAAQPDRAPPRRASRGRARGRLRATPPDGGWV